MTLACIQRTQAVDAFLEVLPVARAPHASKNRRRGIRRHALDRNPRRRRRAGGGPGLLRAALRAGRARVPRRSLARLPATGGVGRRGARGVRRLLARRRRPHPRRAGPLGRLPRFPVRGHPKHRPPLRTAAWPSAGRSLGSSIDPVDESRSPSEVFDRAWAEDPHAAGGSATAGRRAVKRVRTQSGESTSSAALRGGPAHPRDRRALGRGRRAPAPRVRQGPARVSSRARGGGSRAPSGTQWERGRGVRAPARLPALARRWAAAEAEEEPSLSAAARRGKRRTSAVFRSPRDTRLPPPEP